MLERLEVDSLADYYQRSSSLKRVSKLVSETNGNPRLTGTITNVEPVLFLSNGKGHQIGDVRVPGFRQINLFLEVVWKDEELTKNIAALQAAWHVPLASEEQPQEGAQFEVAWFGTRNTLTQVSWKVTEVYAWLKSL